VGGHRRLGVLRRDGRSEIRGHCFLFLEAEEDEVAVVDYGGERAVANRDFIYYAWRKNLDEVAVLEDVDANFCG
jgi:hypothetical protein